MAQNPSGNKKINNEIYWFVVQKKCLWGINPNIIGFWNPAQWCHISVGDEIIYYRSQCNKQVKGLFKVVKKGVDIDPSFSRQLVQNKHPIYQLSLRSINTIPKIDRIIRVTNLSFYSAWLQAHYGRYGQQVFIANANDINIIF